MCEPFQRQSEPLLLATKGRRNEPSSYLSDALGAAPVAPGHILQGRDQAEGVVAVVAAVAQQQAVLLIAPAAHQAEVEVNLRWQGGHQTATKPKSGGAGKTPKHKQTLTKLTSSVSLRGLILMAKA